MNRPDRYMVMMQTAKLWATRSTCSRLAVGAVVHRDWRILVQGYNGAPAGLPHCDHTCTCGSRFLADATGPTDHQPGCKALPEFCLAVHAEQNAIAWAARAGVRLEGADLVCTDQPCLTCARSIINAGIRSVMYERDYRLEDGLNLLLQAGVYVSRSVDGEPPEMVRYGA